MPRQSHLDLFSGIGGFALAAKWAGLQTIQFVELDPYCQRVLKKNFPDVPIHDDITTLDGTQFKDIFLITGGFPCQDISIAGKGAGLDGERSGLWTELHRIIGEVRPRFALIENVPALTFRGGARVIGDLAEIGYDCEWQIVGADDVGAPHRRKRIWIVAHSDSDRVFSTAQKHFRNRPEENGKERQAQSCNSSQSSTDVAYSKSAGCQTWSSNRMGTEHGSRRNERLPPGASGTPETLADSNSTGCKEQWRAISNAQEQSAAECRGRWLPEPSMGRVAHGIPHRVDRLRGIGNAIVPQVAFEIIKTILNADCPPSVRKCPQCGDSDITPT